jgi:hypothetical protein
VTSAVYGGPVNEEMAREMRAHQDKVDRLHAEWTAAVATRNAAALWWNRNDVTVSDIARAVGKIRANVGGWIKDARSRSN